MGRVCIAASAPRPCQTATSGAGRACPSGAEVAGNASSGDAARGTPRPEPEPDATARRQKRVTVVQRQAKRIEGRMGISAATTSNLVGLPRSVGAAQFDRHPPLHARPPVLRAGTLSPHVWDGLMGANGSVRSDQFHHEPPLHQALPVADWAGIPPSGSGLSRAYQRGISLLPATSSPGPRVKAHTV